MVAPNGGITITTQDTSAVEGFIEALCIQITGNGTRFTGTGPSPTPVTETHDETVTVPGDVSVALDW
jgi:hypothetical protein